MGQGRRSQRRGTWLSVFAFTAPLKMMLHPNATFSFSNVAGISVSGYLVNFTGP
jgi:hypothetical protein